MFNASPVASWLTWLRDLIHDMGFGFRMLPKTPGFTAVAVLSLALGIGAGTSVFSLVNAVLLRSLPVPNAQQLRVLRWAGTDSRVPSFGGRLARSGSRHAGDAFSHPAFLSLREGARPVADLFGFSPIEDIAARGREETFAARGMLVSDNFFRGLATRPFLGRALEPGEDFLGSGRSVVISHRWWERHFALDPAVIGQQIQLNGAGFTIVGVLPRGFPSVLQGQDPEFYAPMAAPSPLFQFRPITGDFHWHVRLMARLLPGATDTQLRTVTEAAFARAAREVMGAPAVSVEPGNAGLPQDRGSLGKPLLLMLGSVGLVLLVACANLAGLSLARGTARRHELAVRAALGAGRGRLIRQSLSESLVLALLGGGSGVLLSIWGTQAISRLLSGSPDGLRYDLSLDVTVLGFSLGMTLVTALLSGLLPALRAGSVPPAGCFQGRTVVGASRLGLGRGLVVAQVGLSLLLLAGAGLYLRSLLHLARVDAGFRTDQLLLVQTNIRSAERASAQPAEFYGQLQDALGALPGVQGATLIEFPLLAGVNSSGSVFLAGRPSSDGSMTTRRLTVGETFFTTLGIPLRQGRGLLASDVEGAPKVVVVNEAFARECLPGENPVGHALRMYEAEWRIVGVCADARYGDLKQRVSPTTYFPFRQRLYSRFRTTHLRGAFFALRTEQPVAALAGPIRKAVAGLDPGVSLGVLTSQADVRDQGISQERLLAALCASLACLALLLSCVGLYGLMAYQVARRTTEIALRMALGATRRSVAVPVVREALLLALLGVAAGVPTALALVRFIRSQLHGVDPVDPVALLATSLLLAGVALLSAWLPAWRAARIDPSLSLRAE